MHRFYAELIELGFANKGFERGKIALLRQLQNGKQQKIIFCHPCRFLTYESKQIRINDIRAFIDKLKADGC